MKNISNRLYAEYFVEVDANVMAMLVAKIGLDPSNRSVSISFFSIGKLLRAHSKLKPFLKLFNNVSNTTEAYSLMY